MSRKLIIDGNAVYEVDEQCMLRRNLDERAENDKNTLKNEEDKKKDEDDKKHYI